jgi:hypothetical protein
MVNVHDVMISFIVDMSWKQALLLVDKNFLTQTHMTELGLLL